LFLGLVFQKTPFFVPYFRDFLVDVIQVGLEGGAAYTKFLDDLAVCKTLQPKLGHVQFPAA
jgi:hypothetical protein